MYDQERAGGEARGADGELRQEPTLEAVTAGAGLEPRPFKLLILDPAWAFCHRGQRPGPKRLSCVKLDAVGYHLTCRLGAPQRNPGGRATPIDPPAVNGSSSDPGDIEIARICAAG